MAIVRTGISVANARSDDVLQDLEEFPAVFRAKIAGEDEGVVGIALEVFVHGLSGLAPAEELGEALKPYSPKMGLRDDWLEIASSDAFWQDVPTHGRHYVTTKMNASGEEQVVTTLRQDGIRVPTTARSQVLSGLLPDGSRAPLTGKLPDGSRQQLFGQVPEELVQDHILMTAPDGSQQRIMMKDADGEYHAVRLGRQVEAAIEERDSVGNVINPGIEALIDAHPPAIFSAEWTGVPNLSQRATAIRSSLPAVMVAVEALISSYENMPSDWGHNGGPPIDEHEEALCALREFHQSLGHLLAAAESESEALQAGGLIPDALRTLNRMKLAFNRDPVAFGIAGMAEVIFCMAGMPGGGVLSAIALEARKKSPD